MFELWVLIICHYFLSLQVPKGQVTEIVASDKLEELRKCVLVILFVYLWSVYI